MKNAFLISVVLIALACSAVAQTSIRQIDAYVKTIDKIVENKRSPKVVTADVSDENTTTPEWRRFASEKALEKHRKTSETYTIAYNWKNAGRTVASNFTLFSPSGDWSQYVNHYFRPDGTAAFIRTELRTFMGDYIVIHDTYFDAKGRQIKKRSKYLDLTTQKPKKPTDEMLDENGSFYKVDIYKTVAKLPFARLLGGK